MSTFLYKVSGVSDAGNIKEINQDAFLVKMGTYNREQFLLALVADGMGGVAEGEMASRSVKAAFLRWYEERMAKVFEAENIEEALLIDWEEIIASTHLQLNEYGRQKGFQKGRSPGTTLSIVLLYGGTHYIANIGDSRVYKQSSFDERLKQLTKDHSWEQEAREAGMSDDEIEFDARRNSITRCIGCGFDHSAQADYYIGAYLPDEYYLICTDGFRHYLSTEEITRSLLDEGKNTKEKCLSLINLVKDRGETDNITGIIIKTLRGTSAANEGKPSQRTEPL